MEEKRKPKVGDKINVHGELNTVIEEIVDGYKYYFRDEDGKRWYVDDEADFEFRS